MFEDVDLITYKKGFEDSPNSMLLVSYVDKKPRIIEVNKKFREYYGYSLKEVFGKDPKLLSSGKQNTDFYKQLWQDVLNPKKGYFKGEIINRKKNGDLIKVILSINTVFDDKGRAVKFIANHVDITELDEIHNRLSKSEEKYRLLFNGSNLGVIYIDFKGTVIDYNRKISDIFKLPEKNLRGESIFKWTPKVKLKDSDILPGFKRLLSGKQISSNEWVIHNFNNDKITILVDYSIIKSNKNKREGIAVMIQDITDKKKAEDLLKESEAKYKTLFDELPFIAFTLDTKGRLIDCNKAAEDKIGLNLSKLRGKSFSSLDILNRRDLTKAFIEFGKNLTGKITDKTIYEVNVKGKKRLLELIGMPIRKNGGIVSILDIGDDVTDKIKANERIKAGENLYRIVSEKTGSIVYDYNIKTGQITWLGPIEAVTGFKPDEFNKVNIKKWVQMIHPSDRKEALRYLKESMKKNTDYNAEYRFINKKGDYDYISDQGMFIYKNSKPVNMIGLMKVINRQKMIENNFKEYNNRLSIVNKLLLTGNKSLSIDEAIRETVLLFTSLDGADGVGIYLVSDGFARIKGHKGLSDEFIKGVSVMDINKKPYSDVFIEGKSVVINNYNEFSKVHSAISGLKSVISVPIFLKGKIIGAINAGSKTLNEFSLEDIKTIEYVGKNLGIIISRLKVEEDLLHEKEKLQKYFDVTGLMMVVINKEGFIESANNKCAEILEVRKENLIGKNWFDNFILPDDKKVVADYFSKLIKSGSGFDSFENRIVTSSGKERLILWHNTILKDENGIIISSLSAGEDITGKKERDAEIDRLKQDDEINRARKDFLLLVTHELKQPLTPIMGYADLLKEKTMDIENLKYLDRIINGAQEMFELITKIINLMRIETGQLLFNFRTVSLNDLFNDSLKKKAPYINLKNLQIVKNIKDVKFEGDYNLLRDVIVNLIDNAIKFSKENSVIELVGKPLKNKVFFSVKDHGEGIPKEELPKLFKTFSQTIEGRKRGGFGIGLSMCKMVIDKHKGKISISSKLGIGSKFSVLIPKRYKA